jgi:hypothetical protein
MAKAKAATKAKGKVEKPVEVEENEDNAVVEEPKKRGRGKPVKAEVAEETVDVKPKRATKAAQPAKAKEESVPKSTPAEPKTNGVAKSKPAKKPASKRTQKADAEKGESEKEMPVESPKKRARKNETKVENEEPEKKRGKKKADEVEDEEPPKVESPKKAQAKMTSFLTKDSKVKAPKEETKGKAGKPLLNSIDSDYNIEFNIKEAFKTKIVTWNVAGLRSSVQKGCVEYLKREAADIICLNVSHYNSFPHSISISNKLIHRRSKSVRRRSFRKRSNWPATTLTGTSPRESREWLCSARRSLSKSLTICRRSSPQTRVSSLLSTTTSS